MTTPFLLMRELETAQSQPEVIVNEDIRKLEAAISIDVLDKDLTTPPTTPGTTDRYIVPAAGATGAWAAHPNTIAYLLGTSWAFLSPRKGWVIWVEDEAKRYEWNGSAFVILTLGGSISVVGTDDSPDTTVASVTSIRFANADVTDVGGGIALVTPEGGPGGNGTQTTVAIVANAIAIDHALGADFDLQLTSNVTTVTHSNVTAGAVASWFSMRVRQDGVGSRTFTPPASWIYPSGVSAYTVSSGAADIDLVQGVTYNNGTTWMISYEKDYV